MRKYIAILFSVAALATVSCNKEIEPVGSADGCGVSYSFCANVGNPETKVTYHDNIGTEDNHPYNPNSDGSNKITMSWRDGDELVAIRWKEPYDEYVVLQANIAEGEESHSISFDTETATNHFKTALKDGERFVLVHGDFVLDPNKGDHTLTFDGVTPKLAFPTSEVSKDGFGGYIHHGGVVEGNKITFRNQDGTLENLRKHEYMVADAYVHFEITNSEGNPIPDEKTGIIYVTLTDSQEKEGGNSVEMRIAHTLLRLTMFLPDEDFDNGYDDDLIAVSIRDASLHKIFHRYFRMHPNASNDGPNYYKTSYNPNSDKEENPYIRINLVDEVTGKHGVNHRTNNILGAEGFNPKQPVCVPGTVKGKDGHYVTLYFSLPARHMGVEGQDPSHLEITAFTRTHAYRTVKTYQLPDEAMQPGQVVPLNVNFVDNSVRFRAITDPELGITFAPGLVYAHRESESDAWEYSIYPNQGEYGGIYQQSGTFGDYFCFGSLDPNEVFHIHPSTSGACQTHTYYINNKPNVNLTVENDVAAQVKVTVDGGDAKGIDNLFSIMTKAEAERVWARLKEDIKKGGFKGYYYYTGHLHTGHQALGAHKNLPEGDARRNMSSTLGVWVGIDHQPSLEEQDNYVFLPSSNQLNNATTNMIPYANSEGVLYYASKDYQNQRVASSETKQEGYIQIPEGTGLWYSVADLNDTGNELKDVTVKFSMNTRENASSNNCYRLQIWYKSGNAWTSSGIAEMDKTFGRVVRPVIY